MLYQCDKPHSWYCVWLYRETETFQRLPIYQCFKRQLINVICIWATEYVNSDWESLEECSQLDSQEQRFSKAVAAQLGNAITKFGLLQSFDTQWSFLSGRSFSCIFPLFLNSRWDSSPSLEECKPSRCLSCHTPFQTHNAQIVPGCSPPMGSSHKRTYKGGPTCLICFMLKNEFSELINNLLILQTPVLCACELLKPSSMTCWLQEWCLLSCRVTEALPKYIFSFFFCMVWFCT